MTYSVSLKLVPQQLGAYTQSSLRLPHRWHGWLPLHLILRRLHSLLTSRQRPGSNALDTNSSPRYTRVSIAFRPLLWCAIVCRPLCAVWLWRIRLITNELWIHFRFPMRSTLTVLTRTRCMPRES